MTLPARRIDAQSGDYIEPSDPPLTDAEVGSFLRDRHLDLVIDVKNFQYVECVMRFPCSIKDAERFRDWMKPR